MSPALHPGFSDLWRSTPALNSTPTTFGFLLVLVVQASSFLMHQTPHPHPPFPTQSVRLPLVTYPSLCNICVTYRALHHTSGDQMLPTQPLAREAEDFPRGEKYFKHVPLLSYLIYFSPKEIYIVGSIYMAKPPHGIWINLSLVLNQRFKSPICW